MKKILSSIIAICLTACSFASCSNSKNSDSDSSSQNKTQSSVSESSQEKTQTSVSDSSQVPKINVSAEEAETYVKELYDAAQNVADRYSTSGGTIITTVIKSADIDSPNAERINFINLMANTYTHEGIWAIKINNFKIESAVYTPYDNSGIIVRYPKAYEGSTDNITSANIDSCL